MFRAGDYDIFFKLATSGGEIQEFTWEVRDWKKVEKDDIFFLVKTGTQQDGIVMHGRFSGKCFLERVRPNGMPGSSKRNEKNHVALLSIQGMFKDNEMLSAEALEEKFPEIDWHSGDSGELLSTDLGFRLVAYVNEVIHGELSALEDDADGEAEDDSSDDSADGPEDDSANE